MPVSTQVGSLVESLLMSIEDVREVDIPVPGPEEVQEFLTSKGLYSRLATGWIAFETLLPDTLDLACEMCGMCTTNAIQQRSFSEDDRFAVGIYACCRCRRESGNFTLCLDQTRHHPIPICAGNIRKIGQYPPPPVKVPTPIRKALSPNQLELYEKGIRCMNIGYGLASAAYFRRLIEDAGDLFLDLIISSAEAEEDQDTRAKALEAKEGIQVKEKLKLAGELLPSSLRIGGHNPLAQMYALLSDNVHARTDDECLEESRILKEDFDYVFESISESLVKAKAMRGRLSQRVTMKSRE